MNKNYLKILIVLSSLILFLMFPCPADDIPSDIAADEQTEQKAEKEMNAETEESQKEEPVNLAEILEGTSGVRVQTMCTNCNVANVTMCGQTGERVQVWKDGLPIMGGLGAIYLLSVMPSEGIASTEIIRGAGTVLSGSEAGAGAVVMKTRTPEKKPYLFASLDMGSFEWQSQKLLGYGQLGPFGGEVSFTHSSSDGIDPNEDGVFDLAAFRRTTAGVGATYTILQRSHFRVNALQYREKQRDGKGGFASMTPEGQAEFFKEDIDIRRDEYSFGWDFEFPDNSLLTLNARSTYREQDTSDTSLKEQPYMLVDETARIAEVRYEKMFLNRFVLTTGTDYRNFNVHGTTVSNPPTFPEGQDINDLIRQRGIYAQIDYPLPKNFSITAGLRYDEFHLHSQEESLLLGMIPLDPRIEDETELLPRLRLAWKPIRSLSFNLSAGDSFSPPRPFFERVCCGVTITLNPDVKPQSSRDYLFDAEFIPRQWMKLRISFFRSDIDNYIQKIPWFSFGYVPSYTQVNYKNVDLKGAELSNEWRFLKHMSAGFEVSRVKAKSEDRTLFLFDDPLFDLPPGQIPYLPENQGSLFAKWDDQGRGLQISAQAQYTGSMTIQTLENFFGLADTYWETPDFWIFNFRIQGRIHENLSLYIGMDNITNEYQLYLDRPEYEYNWGPLRGRYVYAGISFEM